MTSFIEQFQQEPTTVQTAPVSTPAPAKKPLSFIEQRAQRTQGQAEVLLRQYRDTTASSAINAVQQSSRSRELLGMDVSDSSFLNDQKGALARMLQNQEARLQLNQNQRLASWASDGPVNAIMFREYGKELGALRAAYELGEYTVRQSTEGAIAATGAARARQELTKAERAQANEGKTFLEILDERRSQLAEARQQSNDAEDPYGIAALGIIERGVNDLILGTQTALAPVTAARDFARSQFQPSDEEMAYLRRVATATTETSAERQESIESGYQRMAAQQRVNTRIERARAAAEEEGLSDFETQMRGVEAFLSDPVDALGMVVSVVGESSGMLGAGVAAGVLTRSPMMAAGVMGGMSDAYARTLVLPELAKEYGYDISTPEGVKAFINDPRARTLTDNRAATYGMVLGLMDAGSGGLASKTMANSVAGNLLLQGLTQMAMGSGGETLALMASGQELDILEIALEGVAELVTVPVEVGGVGLQQVNIFRKRRQEAEEAQALFGALADTATESEMRKAVPEKYREVVAALTASGPLATVEIDASALPGLFQSGNVTPEKILELLPSLSREELDRAIEQGTLLSIPTSDYQTGVAGTPIDGVLRKHMSFSGSLTAAQVAALDDPSMMEAGRQAVEEFQSGARDLSDAVESARTMLVGELVAANPSITPEMADAQITPILLFAETTASRMGVDTETFIKQFALPRFRQGGVSATLPVDNLTEIRKAGGVNAAVIENAAEAAGLDEEASNEELAEALQRFATENVGEPETAADREVARALLDQDSTDLIGSPLPVERARGRTTVWGLAEALTDRQRDAYGRALDTSDPADLEIVVEAMLAEYKNQSDLLENGVEWYTEDIEAAIEETSKIIPELENRQMRDLFLMVAAILSPQQKPKQNWENAILAFTPYVMTGKLATTKPSGKKFGVLSMGSNLRLLQHMLDTRGVDGTIGFLTSSHTAREMAELRRDSGVYPEGRAIGTYKPSEMKIDDVALGAYMFGPKVGDFLMNATGYDPDAVTVDLWLGRTYRRLTGQLLDVTDMDREARKPAANPTNATERNLMKAPVFEVANRLNKRPSEVQAVLWYYEQRLYREHGINAPSENFKGAAKASTGSRGLADQSPTTDGRAGEEAPESLRERPVTEAEFRQTPLPNSFLHRPGWAGLTADLTGGEGAGERNAARAQQLVEELEKRGIPYRRAIGRYGGPDETSFVILADKETAVELGTMFEQDSIVTRDGLTFMDGRDELPSTGRVLRGGEAVATGFFSRMDDGTVFALELGDGTAELEGTSEDGTELNQSALPETYRVEDLERASPGPVPGVRDNATRYMQAAGLPVRHQNRYVKVDVTRASIIAQLYDQAVDSPNDPEVRAAYEAMAAETVAQYEALLDLGMTFEFIVGDDPYASPADAIRDMQENNHLWVFPTEDGFGTSPITDEERATNPMLRVTEHVVDGRPALVNDLFRIVHDVYGHGSEGASFGPRGEENAWQAHVRMFSPLAARAMTSETRGQNSWVNYGPYGEQNRANPKDTIFADQKAVLLPKWVSSIGQADDLPVFEGQPVMPRMMRSAVPPREGTTLFQSARAPVLHSALVNFLETAKQDSAPAKDWLSILGKAPGIKELELVWTGVYDYLDRKIEENPKAKVSRNELLRAAQYGFLRLVPRWVEGPGRHEQYVEDGAYDAYVELLGLVGDLEELGPNERRPRLRPFAERGHFTEENVVTHIRATHRGEVFFVEEVQSDLNNNLRKSTSGMPSLADMRGPGPVDARSATEAEIAVLGEQWREARSAARPYDREFRDALRGAVSTFLRALPGAEEIAAEVEGIGYPLMPTLASVVDGEHLVVPLTDGGQTIEAGVYFDPDKSGAELAESITRQFAVWTLIDRNATDLIPSKEDGGVANAEAAMKAEVARAGKAIDEGKPLVNEALRLEREHYLAETALEDDYAFDEIPWTPFPDENAINVAAKKSLYHAAENGFAQLQWTTSKAQGRRWRQQVEQVNASVKKVKWSTWTDIDKSVDLTYETPDGFDMKITLDVNPTEEGTLVVGSSTRYREQLVGKKLSDIVGDDITAQVAENEQGDLDNPEVRFRASSGEGYINVYDRQMRKALDKIGKPFGARVELVEQMSNANPDGFAFDIEGMSREELESVRDIAIFAGLPEEMHMLNFRSPSWYRDVEWATYQSDIDELQRRAYAILPELERLGWQDKAGELREQFDGASDIEDITVANFVRVEGISEENARAAIQLSRMRSTLTTYIPYGQPFTDDFLTAVANAVPSEVVESMRAPAEGAKRPTGEKVWGIEINDAMRESVLSEGFTLYQRQRTETAEFQRWFDGSVVRNMDGSPMVQYHGTNAIVDFGAFFPMTHMGTVRAATDRLNSLNAMKRRGTAEDAERMLPVYASIKRPLPLGQERNESGDWWDNDIDMWEQVIRVVEFAVPSVPEGWEDRAALLSDFYASQVANGNMTMDDWADFRREMAAMIEELGFDGLSYINGYEDPGNMSYVALQPQQIKSVFNSGRFDPQEPDMLAQENRGSITLPPPGNPSRSPIVSVFKGNDESTVIHEGAHWFLYVYEELVASGAASPDISEMYGTLKSWWRDNAEAVATEAGGAVTPELVEAYLNKGTSGQKRLDADIYRGMHELFARGFERYMREGKAPSADLNGLFARFQAWLVELYKSATKLRVPLTDEVRDVFDRMLVADKELEKARAKLTAPDVIARDAASLGVSEEEYKNILRLSGEAQDTAREETLREIMRPLRESERERARVLRLGIAAEVEREIGELPAHRAIQWLGNERWFGEQPDDLPKPSGMRFDREMFIADYGLDRLKALPRGRRALYETGTGMTPDDLAGWFGFPSGDAMLTAIENAPRFQDAVKAEIDRRVREEIGDPISSGEMGDIALRAIQNDKRGDLIAAELRALSKNASRSTPRTTRSALREIARRQIAQMPARQATKSDGFLQASQRAAVRAQQALAKGDFDAAYDAKRQELLQHSMFRASRDAAEELRKLENRVARLRKKTTRQNIDGVYLAAIDEIMDRYDFRKTLTQTEERRRGALQAYLQMMEEQNRTNELAIPQSVIDRAQKTPYRTLPMRELRDVLNALKNIEHTGRFKQKLIEAQRQRELDEVAADVAEAIRENVRGKPPARTRRGESSLKQIGRGYLNLALNADTMLREYDGWDRGAAYDALKEGIDDAENRAQEMRAQASTDIEALYSVYTQAEIGRMGKVKTYPELKTKGDPKASFAKWDLISMVLNMGNEQSLDRLMDRDTGYGYSQAQIDFIKSQLDERDIAFVQSVWDYVETYWPMIAEREERTTGVAPEKVPASEVTFDNGTTLRGGYYPIVYDPRIKSKVIDDKQGELLTNMLGGRFGKAQTRNGHLKERAAGSGGRVLELGMHVLHQHVGQVIHDLALSESVNASWRILQHPEVVAAMEENGRLPDKGALEVWLQDVATGPMVAGGVFGRVAMRAKNNFTLSKLAFNLSTVMIQMTGVTQSMVVVGKGRYLKATMDYHANPRRWVKEVLAVSPFMRERETTFHRDIYDMQNEMLVGPERGLQSFQQNVGKIGYFLMMKVQFYGVDMPTWLAGYRQGLEKFGNDEAKARKHADRMVARAQASGLMADRTAFERGTLSANTRQNGFVRLFTTLGSYMFAKANVAYERVGRGSQEVRDAGFSGRALVAAMSTAFDLALLFTLEAILYHLIKGTLPGLGGDDDDESFARFAARETFASGLSTIPVARDFAGPLSGFSAGGAYGAIGDTITAPLVQAAQGEVDMALFRSISSAIGLGIGFPSGQLNRTVDSIVASTGGEDVAPMEFILGRNR